MTNEIKDPRDLVNPYEHDGYGGHMRWEVRRSKAIFVKEKLLPFLKEAHESKGDVFGFRVKSKGPGCVRLWIKDGNDIMSFFDISMTRYAGICEEPMLYIEKYITSKNKMFWKDCAKQNHDEILFPFNPGKHSDALSWLEGLNEFWKNAEPKEVLTALADHFTNCFDEGGNLK